MIGIIVVVPVAVVAVTNAVLDVLILSVVIANGTFCNGVFVASGFKRISGMSCFLPLLPERMRDMLG